MSDTQKYVKDVTADLEAVGLVIISDMSAKAFVVECADREFSADDLDLVISLAHTDDFTKFYRKSPGYTELPSGAGFVYA